MFVKPGCGLLVYSSNSSSGKGTGAWCQFCKSLFNRTYWAQIFVNVKYTRDQPGGHKVIDRCGVPIGKIPIMLRSGQCVLTDKSEAELAA